MYRPRSTNKSLLAPQRVRSRALASGSTARNFHSPLFRAGGLRCGLGIFESFAEFVQGTAVLLLGEDVPGGEEQRDRPLDDLQSD